MANLSDFFRGDNVEDRRSENHHRPLVWRPERSWQPYQSPFTDMAHQLGQTILENQIADNVAAARQSLENSPLAAGLGVNDIGKSTLTAADYANAKPTFAAQPIQGIPELFRLVR